MEINFPATWLHWNSLMNISYTFNFLLFIWSTCREKDVVQKSLCQCRCASDSNLISIMKNVFIRNFRITTFLYFKQTWNSFACNPVPWTSHSPYKIQGKEGSFMFQNGDTRLLSDVIQTKVCNKKRLWDFSVVITVSVAIASNVISGVISMQVHNFVIHVTHNAAS